MQWSCLDLYCQLLPNNKTIRSHVEMFVLQDTALSAFEEGMPLKNGALPECGPFRSAAYSLARPQNFPAIFRLIVAPIR
jgi:hypothetical protein